MAIAETTTELARHSSLVTRHWSLNDWVTTVDHKKIGILYVVMAVVFQGIGGCEAVLLRWQLLWPRNDVIGPDLFNQLFTMHGTTMVFFMGIPILVGFGNYLVPLMIGARDMALPRLNALGLWATLLGGLLVYFSFATGGAPAIGWFAYAPLTERTFARSSAVDFWALGLIVSGVGTTTAAINFIATILAMRAPGMELRKVPFFVWTIMWTSVLILFAIPPLTAGLAMVVLDRNLGAHFFDVQNGGSALLWQHVFWFFGHPEVYILVLPAFGIVSDVLPVFSRKVIFGGGPAPGWILRSGGPVSSRRPHVGARVRRLSPAPVRHRHPAPVRPRARQGDKETRRQDRNHRVGGFRCLSLGQSILRSPCLLVSLSPCLVSTCCAFRCWVRF